MYICRCQSCAACKIVNGSQRINLYQLFLWLSMLTKCLLTKCTAVLIKGPKRDMRSKALLMVVRLENCLCTLILLLSVVRRCAWPRQQLAELTILHHVFKLLMCQTVRLPVQGRHACGDASGVLIRVLCKIRSGVQYGTVRYIFSRLVAEPASARPSPSNTLLR